MRRALALTLCITAAGITAAGCLGRIGDPPTGEASEMICGASVLPGPSPIRRMTRFEYNNTVRDLLGDTSSPAADFGAEEEALGFNNNAANLVTSSALAEKYMLAAEGVAGRATEPLTNSVACDPAVVGEEPCARQFIETFGKRAFRRPLAPGEADTLYALYEVGHAEAGFRLGVQLVIQAVLQSPEFLYRVEISGEPGPEEGVVTLNDWEMASRLSYFLWGTMPDEELFAAAEAGELRTKEQIADQARRMLSAQHARDAAGNFHRQWLDYDRIANVGKDTALFPEWSPLFKDLMRQETEKFLEAVVFDEEGSLSALLTAPYSFLNPELAAFYGAPAPSGAEFERVQMDPEQHAGILTMGSVLTINAHSNQTSPVHRGKLVRELFLCDVILPPPPEIMITVPAPDPNSTARERFAQHSENATCKGCHQLMDPIGFGFESYDGVGRFRTMENEKPVDAKGELTQTDVDGEFEGVVELAHKLTASRKVSDCYAKQWFRFAYGRGETKEDTCTMDALEKQFEASGGDIKELLIALTQTDAFLYRRTGGAQ